MTAGRKRPGTVAGRSGVLDIRFLTLSLLALSGLLLIACSKERQGLTGVPTKNEFSVNVKQVTSPVHPGDQAFLTLSVVPEAECQADFAWQVDGEKPDKLSKKTAGPDGIVAWNWKVRQETRVPQTVQVAILCSESRRRATAATSFEVQK